MHVVRFSLLILGIIFTATSPLLAEENIPPETKQLQSELDSVRADIDSIRANYITQPDLASLKDLFDEQIRRGFSTRQTVNFSGFGILGNYSAQRVSNSFVFNSAALTFAGNLREDPVLEGDLKYRVTLIYVGASAPGASTSFAPADAVLIWDLRTTKSDLEPSYTASLTLGQQLLPFGSDNQAAEDKLPTIKKAQYVSSYGIGRDIGIKAESGIVNRFDPTSSIVTPLLAFTAGVFNGSGANKFESNTSKEFVGRVTFSPVKSYFSTFRGLKLSTSYLRNTLPGTGAVIKRDIFSYELEWLRKPFLVTSEYLRGKDKGAVETDKRGFVATLFWTPGTLPDFQPLVRYDTFDPSHSAKGDQKTILTLGFNYFFYQTEPMIRRSYETKKTERVVKLQANYNRIDEEKKDVKNDEFLAQFVFSF